MKPLTFILIGLLTSFSLFSQQTGGPYTSDENTILLMHFNNDLIHSGAYTGNIINWGKTPVYNSSLTNLDQAFRIDNASGSDQCLLIEPTSELHLGNHWSIELWVKSNSYGSSAAAYPSIFIKDGEGVSAIGIGLRSDGLGFNCRITFADQTEISIEQSNGLDHTKWHHITLSSDSIDNQIYFTVKDENFESEFSDSKTFPDGTNGELITANRQVFVGGVDGSSNIQFDGWIDELRISNTSRIYHPETPALLAETEFIEFYASEDEMEKWDEIKDNADNWFKGLRSYWERPGSDLLFNEDEKVKIYLVEKEYLTEYVGFSFPDWRYGGYKIPNELYVALPPGGENDIYEGSFPVLVKNILAQLVLKKRQIRDIGGYSPFYFREGFGLLYSGYRPNQDSILQALSDLGRAPLVSDFLDVSDFATSYKKDLMVSYIEAQALSAIGIQKFNTGGYETVWERHLKHYYQNDENTRITLRKETDNFNIYSAHQDVQYIDEIADKLEEKLSLYETTFEFPIYHKINLVIYPDRETAQDCIVFMDSYSMGSGWSGDKLDILSPLHLEDGLTGVLDFLIPHEFFHVFHFNLVTHLFSIPAFYSEGLANHMSQGFVVPETEDDLWKIQVAFDHYSSNYSRQPNLADFLVSEVDATYNYHNDPYFFGEAFYSYMMSGVATYVELKAFFAGDLDYSVFSKSYEEIDIGYINYLKSIAGIQTDAPGQPSNPNPANEATAVNTNPTITWTNGSNTDESDLYFGTTNPPTEKVQSNASSTSYQPSPLNYSTTYYWKVVNKNSVGNTEGSVWSFTTDIGTGINDLHGTTGFSVYPNPAIDKIYITSPEEADLSIFNISGQKVLGLSNFIEGEINISSLNKGTYIVIFITKRGRLSKQFIVK